MRRTFLSLFAAAVVLALPSLAEAAPRLSVTHVQGADAPWVVGWNEAVVTLDNADLPSFRGEVLVDSSYDRHADDRGSLRVPVSLAAGESVRLLMPFHLNAGTFPNVVLRAPGEGEVASQALSLTRPIEGVATIVEIQGKDARGPKLVEVPVGGAGAFDEEEGAKPAPPMHPPPHMGGKGVMPPVASTTGLALATAQVTTVQVARESGDPILPDIAGGWSGAALIVAPSDILARLSGRQLDSLEHWVRSGGTIAIAVVRDEDLRSEPIKRLLGGEARVTSGAGASEMSFAGLPFTRGDVTKDGNDGDYLSHGLGETWLLRRDPWAKTFDAKSPRTLYGLWAHATKTRSNVLSLPAGTGLRWYDEDRVRKFLDPNHGFRPSLGIAAVLVVAYALLVGPFAFARARKSGRPLDVLRMTPVLALVLFAVLVGLGKLGKGFKGRARRLSVVEVAGGSTQATSTSMHAFYVADPSIIDVVASRPIDTVHVVEPTVDGDPIELDRGSIAVRAVRAHPWQTVVVAEEGARTLQGAVVLEGNGPRLTLINNTPWTLEHVVLHPETMAIAPARSRYFPSVPPGGVVVARDGLAVDRRIRPYGHAAAGDTLIPAKDPAGDAIDAVEALITSWPGASTVSPSFDIPMATAIVRIDGGTVSGLKIEREAMLLRVVGLGGGKGKGSIEPDAPKGKEGELIRVRHLTHRYGDREVVRDVSFHVRKGEIFGFIGPNGAGKTTTIRIMATLMEPSSGRVEIDDIDVEVDPEAVRRRIGYMADNPGVYDRVTVAEYLEFFAAAYRVPVSERTSTVAAVVELTDLGSLRDRLVAELSKGMKQRIQLARTLLHDPKVLILDEPASDLDPRARIEMRDLLMELRRMGKTIFLSSHILAELADMCTSVAILEKGRLVAAGPVDAIARAIDKDGPERARRRARVRVLGTTLMVSDVLVARGVDVEPIGEVTSGNCMIAYDGDDQALADMVRALVAAGVPLVGLEPERNELERIFLEVTRGEVQ